MTRGQSVLAGFLGPSIRGAFGSAGVACGSRRRSCHASTSAAGTKSLESLGTPAPHSHYGHVFTTLLSRTSRMHPASHCDIIQWLKATTVPRGMSPNHELCCQRGHCQDYKCTKKPAQEESTLTHTHLSPSWTLNTWAGHTLHMHTQTSSYIDAQMLPHRPGEHETLQMTADGGL